MRSGIFNLWKYASILWLVLTIHVCATAVYAQQIPTRHFTMKDGLPSMGIRCVFKDSRGLIWIGTDAGLCTYDGRVFNIFKASEGITASNIWSIAEDELGNLWFGSFGDGLYKYDGRNFEHYTVKDGLIDNFVRLLYYSENFHCLMVGTKTGISTVKGNIITRQPENRDLEKISDEVFGFMDAGKFIYIASYFYPRKYYPDQNTYIYITDTNDKFAGTSWNCYLTSKKDTVFSLGHGVKIISKNGNITNDTLGSVFGIAEDNTGNLWFAGWSYPERELKGGIFRYDGKTFRNYKTVFGITDHEIWSVYFDKEQEILWVGTLNEGLFVIPLSAFSEYDATFFKIPKLKINNLYVDFENAVWISDHQQLIKKLADDQFIKLDNRKMIRASRNAFDLKYNVIGDGQLDYNVLQLIKHRPDQLDNFEIKDGANYTQTIAGKDNSILFQNKLGLFGFDEKKKIIEYLLINYSFGDALLVNDTLFWAGWGPTFMIPHIRNQLKPKLIISNYKGEKRPKNVNRLVKSKNRIWYVSWLDGLWMSEGLKFTNFNQTDKTISNDLTSICFDLKGNIIFGSNTGEICIATYQSKKLEINHRISSEQGLQGNSITWLITDKKGYLWAGTNFGINRIDLNELYKKGNINIRFFDEEEGYTGHSSKRVSIDQSGNLWIGAIDRLIKMESAGMYKNNVKPGKIILKNLDINNLHSDKVLTGRHNPWTRLPEDKFSLHHTENSLIFYFDILNYLNPTKDRFRCMLKGYDKKWTEWSSSRRAVYTNLPPGNYTLIVESINLNSGSKTAPLEVEFRIRFPWWRLWYVQVSLLLLLSAAVVFIVRKTISRVKYKEQEKSEIARKIAELEIMALQAQMNPHFIFNSINSIQYFVLSNKTDDVLSYLSDFSKVVRASLANVTKKMVPLNEEIDFLKSYLRIERMRFPDKFKFIVALKGELYPLMVMIPPYLIQPFAENSVKHGFIHKNGTGHLYIDFEKIDDETLKCTVTDDGIGRIKAREIEGSNTEPARPHSCVITETRIRLLNSPDKPDCYKVVYTDLTDNEGNSAGLKVEIYLPVENA